MPLWYLTLLGLFALLRLGELRVSSRHKAFLLASGGRQVPEPFYPLMVLVHAGLFPSSAFEAGLLQRSFHPLLAGSMLFLLGVCLAVRIWIWRSLGKQWTVQVVTSNQPVVDRGPYRYTRHPNYTVVTVEVFALPLVHSAYLTALFFSGLNALVLWKRVCLEEAVLFERPDYKAKMGSKPRFLPTFRPRPRLLGRAPCFFYFHNKKVSFGFLKLKAHLIPFLKAL